ncbi:hypothetical protein [Deferrisoma camini]|uniref:hypothetical protein n=1 Tax=Deferrisoma camini TaxID=1035120 RepID=UPI00046D7939|nr:hypothetical protein [Deferrisoma camini]
MTPISRPIRASFGLILGAAAGVSLLTGIIPWVLGLVLSVDSLWIRLQVAGYLNLVALIWAGVGATVGAFPGSRTGSGLLGAAGLATGLTLARAVPQAHWTVVVLGAVTGLAYGSVGGFLVGRVLERQG